MLKVFPHVVCSISYSTDNTIDDARLSAVFRLITVARNHIIMM